MYVEHKDENHGQAPEVQPNWPAMLKDMQAFDQAVRELGLSASPSALLIRAQEIKGAL